MTGPGRTSCSPRAGRPSPRALLLPDAGARAYLVQDHEPDFYGASARGAVGRGDLSPGAALHRRQPVAGGAAAQPLRRQRRRHFDLAVDHAVYRPGAAGLAARTWSSSTPRRHPAARGAARAARARGAVARGGRAWRSRCTARTGRLRGAVRAPPPGRARRRAARRAVLARDRRHGASRSPTRRWSAWR